MRVLMDEQIGLWQISGQVLDVGGGEAASYRDHLNISGTLTSLNMDDSISPSVKGDLRHSIPFKNESFDSVISFNTLEHLEFDAFALGEMIRVLRPGGQLYVLVPFLYRVHGSPEDYHRHTAAGWNSLLRSAGVPSSKQQIQPLVWDPLATAWALADLAPLGRNWWRMRRILRWLVLGRPLVMRSTDKRLADQADDLVAEYALGYAITATKPDA
jgi:SAM-dependent methyltransferase